MKDFRFYVRKGLEMGPVRLAGRALYTAAYRCIAPWYRKRRLPRLPVDGHKILFASRPDFSDNSKAMFDYLVDRFGEDGPYRFVWLIGRDEPVPELPKNARVARRNTWFSRRPPLSTLREIATSGLIFYTHGSPNSFFPIREGQTTINLWHGCGYKDAPDKERLPIQKNPFSYALVPGDLFVGTKAEFWGCDRDRVLPIGYPRYDLLRREDPDAERFARQLSKGGKLVLWMPTFRNSVRGAFPENKLDWGYDLPLLGSDEALVALDRCCGEKGIALCVKRHALQPRYRCEDLQLENVTFIDDARLKAEGVALYALMRCSDALVSDYSSVSVDYLLLDRPIAYSLDDYEQYRDSRGFVFDNPLDYMPGHHLYRYEDMIGFLGDVARGDDPHREERRRLLPQMHNPCENYCERVWETAVELMKREN